MKFNLPNIFSLSRVIIAPFVFFMLISDDDALIQIALLLFILGAVTDYFDGWIARKLSDVTSWGKFFDPLADKILTSAAFISFIVLEIVPLWMVLIIIFRDVGTTLLRIYADSVQKPIHTSQSAKVKTFAQMVFIIYILILLFLKHSQILNISDEALNNIIYSQMTYFFMLVLTIIAVWTSVEYVLQNRNLIFKRTFVQN